MTLRWIDEKIMLQRFPNVFTNILESVGWKKFAQYRAKNGNKYAEVRLFEATGSDKVLRKFGFINAYDLDKPTFEDNRFIPFTSNLANIGIGDGVKTTFDFPSEYILPGTETVQVADVEVPDTSYTIDRYGKTITFNVAPTGVIKASYALSTKAFEPTNNFSFFLFDDVTFDVKNEKIEIGTGDGTTTAFSLNAVNIKPGSVKVFLDDVELQDLDYVVQNSAGLITFYDAPAEGVIIAADFSQSRDYADASNFDYYDLEAVATGELNTADGMGNLALSAATYTKPSLPTAMTLTNENNLNPAFGRDSLIHTWGSINKDRLALFFRIDAASDPDNIWHVPLYLGRVNNGNKKPRLNTVLIGGCRTGAASTWQKDKELGGHYVDYGADTSNGNNFVNLHQSIGGTYYNKHYLAFITHDKAIERVEAGLGPSVYDDMYHDSFMYIVHPYDKEVGVLDDIYAVHPSGLEQDAELEVEKPVVHERIGIGDGQTKAFHLCQRPVEEKPSVYFDCVEQTDFTYDEDYKLVEFATAPPVGTEITATYNASNLYQYNLAETPVCPMTLDTTTPYNPIGWGIYKSKI